MGLISSFNESVSNAFVESPCYARNAWHLDDWQYMILNGISEDYDPWVTTNPLSPEWYAPSPATPISDAETLDWSTFSPAEPTYRSTGYYYAGTKTFENTVAGITYSSGSGYASLQFDYTRSGSPIYAKELSTLLLGTSMEAKLNGYDSTGLAWRRAFITGWTSVIHANVNYGSGAGWAVMAYAWRSKVRRLGAIKGWIADADLRARMPDGTLSFDNRNYAYAKTGKSYASIPYLQYLTVRNVSLVSSVAVNYNKWLSLDIPPVRSYTGDPLDGFLGRVRFLNIYETPAQWTARTGIPIDGTTSSETTTTGMEGASTSDE